MYHQKKFWSLDSLMNWAHKREVNVISIVFVPLVGMIGAGDFVLVYQNKDMS